MKQQQPACLWKQFAINVYWISFFSSAAATRKCAVNVNVNVWEKNQSTYLWNSTSSPESHKCTSMPTAIPLLNIRQLFPANSSFPLDLYDSIRFVVVVVVVCTRQIRIQHFRAKKVHVDFLCVCHTNRWAKWNEKESKQLTKVLSFSEIKKQQQQQWLTKANWMGSEREKTAEQSIQTIETGIG